jgi:hypothetical protein
MRVEVLKVRLILLIFAGFGKGMAITELILLTASNPRKAPTGLDFHRWDQQADNTKN